MLRTLALIALGLNTMLWAITIKEAQVLTLNGQSTEALTGLKQSLSQETDAKKKYALALEIGDILFDKLGNSTAAESIYQQILKDFPKVPQLGEVYYRLGLTCEKQERFVDAANAYQAVVIRYPKSPYADDASGAIERCFKKNYRDIVALVDSFPISRLEFDERLASMSEQARADTAEKHKLLNEMINDRLFWTTALRTGIAERPDVKDQLSEARKGITLGELYRRAILDQISVDPKEFKPYYKSHPKDFTVPEQVRARQIVVNTKEEADSVLTILASGQLPFDSLAKLRSVDPSKKRGGDMGFFPAGRNPAPVDSVAFELKVGELSSVIPTDKNFVILKVEDRKPETIKKFDEVKGDIENRLKREKHEKIYKKFMEDLKKPIPIDTFPLDKDTLALINGYPITKADLDKFMAKIPPYARSNYETPAAKRQLVDQLVTERLLQAQVEARKLWLPDSVQVQLGDARKSILSRALRMGETTEKITIDSLQVEQYYQTHLADFKVGTQVKAREIVVKTKDSAKIALKRLKTTSFDTVAKELSIAPDKRQGGDMGFFSRGEKPKEIEEAAFRLKPGKTSGIIPVKEGFAIIKVEDQKKEYTKPLSEVKVEIENKLRNQQQEKLWSDFIDGIRENAKIEILMTEETPENHEEK